MSSLNVDLLALGSSASILTTLSQLPPDLDVVVVDIKPRIGGVLASVSTIAGRISMLPLIPIGIPRSVGVEMPTSIVTLKEGDYELKVHGFEPPDRYQGSWFVLWTKAFSGSQVRLILDPQEILPKLVKPRIVTNVRRVYASKRVAILSNGIVVKYKNLVSSWPLDVLLSKLDYVPKKCLEMRKNLTTVAIHASILIEPLTKGSETSAVMYVHSTKASRFHTAIKVPRPPYAVTYVFTSYSRAYPLMPGIIEKIFSEMRRFKIVDPKNLADERHFSYLYASLSKAPEANDCVEELKELGIVCSGRLGQWREASLASLLDQGTTLASYILENLADSL